MKKMPTPTTTIEEEQSRIGQFITELREQRGLTQKNLAELIGTSQSAIARMEAGQQNFTTEMLAKIGQALNRNIVSIGSGGPNVSIEGGHKLHGTVVINSSKNSAVALLCAALLNRGKTTLKKMARIEEVFRIIEVLTSIGVKVRWQGSDVVIEPPTRLKLDGMDIAAAAKTRSALLLIAPLLHRHKSFTIPHTGGCDLGKRTVRPHLFALEKLGVAITTTNSEYEISNNDLHPSDIVMYESGDTATENIVMAAALIPGETTIRMASANYMVQDICLFLVKCGVKISGIGTTTLRITGVSQINQNLEFWPSEDPIEAMFFVSAALTTGSSITIERVPIEFMELELAKLYHMGARIDVSKPYKAKNGHTLLVDLMTHPAPLIALEEKLYGRPFPGLNMDNLPFFIPIATQASGTTLIHDWSYENRIIYSMEITKLRADAVLADPHRMYITGPKQLKAAEIICPPVLRVGALLLICMLAAEGTSILRNVYTINRGYEDLFERLNSLGAKINFMTSL